MDGLDPVEQDDPEFQRHLQSLAMEDKDDDENLLAESISEKRLAAEEKALFDAGKNQAL